MPCSALVQNDEIVGAICGEQMREIVREHDGIRWCFQCRKRRMFEFVVTKPVGPSYYDPNPSIRCGSCDGYDADLFPGRIREWE